MILCEVRGDIFASKHQHIVFAVNADGFNDGGFAGAVSSRYWPELEDTGPQQLGEVLHKCVGNKTFHAIVCHRLGHDGWNMTPRLVERALDDLEIPQEETIGIVLMGAGVIGRVQGADVPAILAAIARSSKSVTVYSR